MLVLLCLCSRVFVCCTRAVRARASRRSSLERSARSFVVCTLSARALLRTRAANCPSRHVETAMPGPTIHGQATLAPPPYRPPSARASSARACSSPAMTQQSQWTPRSAKADFPVRAQNPLDDITCHWKATLGRNPSKNARQKKGKASVTDCSEAPRTARSAD